MACSTFFYFHLSFVLQMTRAEQAFPAKMEEHAEKYKKPMVVHHINAGILNPHLSRIHGCHFGKGRGGGRGRRKRGKLGVKDHTLLHQVSAIRCIPLQLPQHTHL